MNTTRRGLLGTLAAAIGLAPQLQSLPTLEASPKPKTPEKPTTSRVEPPRKPRFPLLICPCCGQETKTISGERQAVEAPLSWDSCPDPSWVTLMPGPITTFTREPCGCPVSEDDARMLSPVIQATEANRR